MEDSHIARTDLPKGVQLFGVFDGHGGAEVARFVEKHFVETLLKNNHFESGEYKKALEETFIEMDKLLMMPKYKDELRKLANNDIDESLAGCTANVCLLTQTEVYCANCGDSRSIIYTNDVI